MFVIVDEDDIIKAGLGFSRGIGVERAGHKYWRRVPYINAKGERAYRYYYNTEEDRRRYAQDRENKKERDRAARKVKYWEKKAGADDEHRLRTDFERDFPQLREARRQLSKLNQQYVLGLLGWEDVPKLNIDSKIEQTFHREMVNFYGEQDPDELHGLPLSVYRALELSFSRIPPTLRKAFDGTIGSVTLTGAANDKVLADRPNMTGYSQLIKGQGKGLPIVIEPNRCHDTSVTRGAHMHGGLGPVETILHEIAHTFLHRMEIDPPPEFKKKFAEWEKFYKEVAIFEPGVTGLAEQDHHERFAESFVAALMYPQQLATAAPRMYEWMRDFIGEEAIPPLTTQPIPGFPSPKASDRRTLRKAKAAYEEAAAKGDADEAYRQRLIIDHYKDGVLQMHSDDARLQWWKRPETKVQRLLRMEDPSNKPQIGGVYQHPDDKFYEVTHGGRTLYMRVGKASADSEFSGWGADGGSIEYDPDTKKFKRYQLGAPEIKEIYDVDGNPLSNLSAVYYLFQDEIPDDHPWAQDLVDFSASKSLGRKNEALMDSRQLKKYLWNMTEKPMRLRYWMEQGNQKRIEEAQKSLEEVQNELPIEIDEDTFRLRSGTFVYDRWKVAGEDLVQQIATLHPDDPERVKLEKEYLSKQPNAAFVLVRDSKGRVVRRKPIIDFDQSGKATMRMHTIRYRNENPDGTFTEIECEKLTSGPHSGEFAISNPIWRALLTPNNETIKRPADLRALCASAAESRRRTWVAVRMRTSGRGEPNYLHVQIEFDGRGSPRLVGDEWKQRLGVEVPRLDMLLGTQADGTPVLKGEAIKTKPLKRVKGKQVLESMVQLMGTEGFQQEAVLDVAPAEIKRKKGEKIVVRLERVIPAKKKGEMPSPPGWDRMPEWVEDALQVGYDKPAAKLTPREAELKELGLLPPWYSGSVSQRRWLKDVYEPEYQRWSDTKDEIAKKSLPERYVFRGVEGSGFPGRVFTRYGAREAARDLEGVKVSEDPPPLKSGVLVYMHKELHPATGEIRSQEIRLLLPSDGSIRLQSLMGLSGLQITQSGIVRVNMNGFAQLRQQLGSLHMTDDVRRAIEARAAELREAAEALLSDHKLDLIATDPDYYAQTGKIRVADLARRGVGLKPMVSGSPFEIPSHQINGIMKTLDNDGRSLWAHWMGTGKTITALATIKIMQSALWEEISGKKPLGRTVVIAPLNTVNQWRDAADQFDEGAEIIGAGKDMIDIDAYIKSGSQDQILIVGPEYFTRHWKKFEELGITGIQQDEAHRGTKNEQTALAKIIAQFEKKFREMPDQQTLLGLMTGTPMTRATSDIKSYIEILSGGEVWGDLTVDQWEKMYCDPSMVPQDLGVRGLQGARLQLKPSKVHEVAGIISKYTDVAMSKDVKGKLLPAVRINESEFEEMIGTQALLYASKMGALSESDRRRLAGNTAVLSADELAGLSEDAKAAVAQAKSISNCPAYKPASKNQYVQVTRRVPSTNTKGEQEWKDEKVDWSTFDPQWLLDRPDIKTKKIRTQLAGRWPSVEEVGPEEVAMYNLHFRHVWTEMGFDSYEQIAGTKITEKQLAKIAKKEGGKWVRDAVKWPRTVVDPDAGPLGIRCRGSDEVRATDPELYEQAKAFQRDYQSVLKGLTPRGWGATPDEETIAAKEIEGIFAKEGRTKIADPGSALAVVCKRYKIDEDRGRFLLGVRAHQYTHKPQVEFGSGKGKIVVPEGKTWISDKRGSQHLPYREEDWDRDLGKPKSAGGFSNVKDGDLVDVPDSVANSFKPKFGAKPKDMEKEEWEAYKQAEMDAWEPPLFRYDASKGTKGSKVAVVNQDNGETVWIAEKDVKARVRTIFDPGMRKERDQFDVAVVVGNAKAEVLMNKLSRFHEGSKPGPDGERQFIVFGNSILESCHTATAALRLMGFKDVNEAIEGSHEYDPEDPNPAGNGKYFVTYIGSTYIGQRDLNIEIFKKVKDRKKRDLEVSAFVDRTMYGRKWKPGHGPAHDRIQGSQWTAEQRELIFKQFKIRVPEAFWVDDDGVQRYFYGSPRSMHLIKEITDLGNVGSITDPKRRATAQAKLDKLVKEYEEIVKNESVRTQPLSKKQMSVFNNCVGIVCSDAAQVGLNLGNAVEMYNYESLASPMGEWQRMTRSARLLPAAVEAELIQRDDGSLGPIGKLMQHEKEIFGPVATQNVTGTVLDLKIDGQAVGEEVDFRSALLQVSEYCRSKATSKKTKADWMSIAARCDAAANLGGDTARGMFAILATTPVPGGTGNIIEYDRIGSYTDVSEGKYGGMAAVREPVNAIKDAINEILTESEKEELIRAGYTPKGGSASTLDPGAVYLYTRAHQIMTFLDTERTRVFAEMRASAGGSIVQDSDVDRKIIDSLTPMDRAILKEAKLLVDVDRFGVSAEVPVYIDVGGGNKAFAGFEKQHPIATEANTRATGRARLTAVENLIKVIQEKTPIRVDLDFGTADAADVESTSKMLKSLDLYLEM